MTGHKLPNDNVEQPECCLFLDFLFSEICYYSHMKFSPQAQHLVTSWWRYFGVLETLGGGFLLEEVGHETIPML
jgi:hypothetical protein